MKKSALTIHTTAIVVALIAVLTTVFFIRPKRAYAADNSIGLDPVLINSDISYFYFGGAKSIHADDDGLTVAAAVDVYSVSYDKKVSHKFNLTADKTHDCGKFDVSLVGGSLVSTYGDTATEYSDHSIIDFDTTADKIYAITRDSLITINLSDTSFDAASASAVTFSSNKYRSIEATAVTVCGGVPYIAVDSNFGVKQDICSVNTETGEITRELAQSDPIIALASLNDTVYALTRDAVCGYIRSGGGLIASCRADGAKMTDIYGHGNSVYALNSLDAIVKLSSDLSSSAVLVASADGAEGFFNTPLGASVKNSTLFVADSVNGRVAALGDSADYVNKTFVNPVAAVSDSAGAIYVAHRYNEVVKIYGDEEHTVVTDGIISDIAVDANKTLYILTADGKIFASRNNEPPALLSDGGYKAITLSVGSDELYALTADSVKKITVKDGVATAADICAASDKFFSLAVDVSGSVFMLARDCISRVDKNGNAAEFPLTVADNPYALGFTSGKIVLSTVDNAFVDYGDAIIVDTYKHRVFTASGAAEGGLDIKLIDSDYERPDVVGDIDASYHDGLIRTALYDTQVFEFPMETPSVYTIAKGRKVIVPEYEVKDAREYSLILIDNLATGELIQGYVYKDSLSEPLPYVPAPTNVGTVYSDATPVYKWPSPNSKTVTGFSAVERGSEFTILDFVESYRDDYNNLWYRIHIADEYEGYMLASNLSMMNYEPIFIRPAYNAKIISYEDSEYAQCYLLTDGRYTQIPVTLPTGTQVEVIGAFDTSLEYTQIKYLDPDLGTLTCYVKTVYIKYNGVNVVLLVAILVIIITVILAAIIIGRVIYLKKRRPVSTSDK